MSYILRQIGTDGSLPIHWFKSPGNFMATGETPARLVQINALNPDLMQWEVVSIAKDQVVALYQQVFATEIAATEVERQRREANFTNARTKIGNALIRLANVEELTRDEVDEMLGRIG